MNFSRLILILLSLLIFSALHAQEEKCGATLHTQELMKDPEYQKNFRERLAAFNKLATQKTGQTRLECANITTIPVAVHFQGISSNDRNCLEDLVNQQIASLNADFQGTNPDINSWTNGAASLFPGISNGETCVYFCVATQDHPSGYSLSDGQMAITINQTSEDRVNAWSGYLNIYVADIGNNILGYSPLGGRGNGDGVVIAKFAFGGQGACGDVSTSASLDRGRTLTHEVGHWFLLNHIWGNGGCSSDDGVEDTPNASGPNYGCPSETQSSCGSLDLHMNYMDYTNDECMYMFTQGQSSRMENYVEANLQNLISKGLTACGPPADPTCTDGIQNGDEIGVDCGGSNCPDCPEPTCDDGIQNGDETGVDCGGSNCAACEEIATCDDGIQNGLETGVDCGAPGCRECPTNCDQNPLFIFIEPDNYGSETTWTLKDENGTEIAGGGPYTDFNNDIIFTELCLPSGCYTFTIFDAFGDGLCCDYGNGQYVIMDVNENILASGASFGNAESHSLSIGQSDCEDSEPPTEDRCGPVVPTTLEYFNNLTRVRINWEPVTDAKRYQLQYRIEGTASWKRVSTSRTRKTLNNLRTGTEYEIQFRSRCPEGWTEFGQSYTFTTLSGKQNSDLQEKLADYQSLTFNKLYPNPARNFLNVDYHLQEDSTVDIFVFDILGRWIKGQQLHQEEGSQKVRLNIQDLQTGTYLLQINTEEESIIKKFIKQ